MSDLWNQSSTITVSDEAELIVATEDNYYNSVGGMSEISTDSANRKTITLYQDLYITADCHIDLGGHSLLLNGYSAVVNHSYHGSFLITNTTIYSYINGAKIIINTPNSIVVIDDGVSNKKIQSSRATR